MTFKYSFIPCFLSLGFAVSAQPNQGNQAVVTIVGDAPEVNTGNMGNEGNINNDAHDFIQSNPYNESQEPPMQQQVSKGNIEPTLENGFHMRYELQSGRQEEPMLLAGISTSRGSASGASTSSGGATSVRSKKHGPSIDERKFNVQKRLKAWLPKRKKRYHPHLCGRF